MYMYIVFLFFKWNRGTSYIFPRIGHKWSDPALQICLPLVRKSSRCNYPRPPITVKLLCVRFQDFHWNLLSIAGRLAKYAPRAALEKSKDLGPISMQARCQRNISTKETPPKYPTQHKRLHCLSTVSSLHPDCYTRFVRIVAKVESTKHLEIKFLNN